MLTIGDQMCIVGKRIKILFIDLLFHFLPDVINRVIYCQWTAYWQVSYWQVFFKNRKIQVYYHECMKGHNKHVFQKDEKQILPM